MGNRSRFLMILLILPLAMATGYAAVKVVFKSPEQVMRDARDGGLAGQDLEVNQQMELAVRYERLKELAEVVASEMERQGTTGVVVAVNDRGLVTVSLGPGHAVEKGVRFHIVREKEYVGSFLVEEVRDGWVAGSLDPDMTGNLGPPRNEDHAWTAGLK